MHSSIHFLHQSTYSSLGRASFTLAPYTFPILNGGSANTVSMLSSAIEGRISPQSPSNKQPSGVFNTGQSVVGFRTPLGSQSGPNDKRVCIFNIIRLHSG